jgi:hypothetical protein
MKATAEFVAFSRRNASFLTEATNIQTVFQSGGSPIITRRQDLFILDEKSTDLSSKTGGAFGDEAGDIHEIFFPGGPMRMRPFYLFLLQGKTITKDEGLQMSNDKVQMSN